MFPEFKLLHTLKPESLLQLIDTLSDGAALSFHRLTDEDQADVESIYSWALVPQQKLGGFAEACYDGNSIDDLIDALTEPQELARGDMDEWGISYGEWVDCVSSALREKLRDRN